MSESLGRIRGTARCWTEHRGPHENSLSYVVSGPTPGGAHHPCLLYYPMILSHPIICSCWEIHITLLYYWSIFLFKLFLLVGQAIYVFLCDGAWGFWPAVCASVIFYTPC
jgi:hypothetical protein